MSYYITNKYSLSTIANNAIVNNGLIVRCGSGRKLLKRDKNIVKNIIKFCRR